MQGSSTTPSAESPIGRILIAAMVTGFLALLIAAATAGYALQQGNRHTDWVIHTYRVESVLTEVRRLVEQKETARRGYMLAGTRPFLDSFDQASAALAPRVAELRALTADNPNQRAPMAEVLRRLAALDAVQRMTNSLVDQGRGAEALRRFRGDSGLERVRRLRETFQTMAHEERRLLNLRDAEQSANRRMFSVVVVVAGLLLVLVTLISFLTVRRYTRELGESRDALSTLNATLEEQVTERTADLALANEEIQRFAYIVSHDLRSPLVNVMGFTAELSAAAQPLAELIDRAEAEAPQIVTEEARLAAREDLPEAIGFIRTSTAKMDRLINAILKLSREGRRVLAPEMIALDQLAEQITDAIRHVIDDRGVTVTIERPMPVIVSDRIALEQILSNLIENATKYRHPTRAAEVHISAEETRGRVIVAVRDNGRGIDPRDHQRIFDLFRRSGQQDQPGEGIGLAHVRALAYRLGGTISVESQLGEGATFFLSLPPSLSIESA
ncbi:sensor histidine kinase [Sphingomonas pseudosanguinis]|uniref:histidine kinase n=1 Tax=Sphingomonas pseudosanguinis TaxID=413712 RepID=A0A7W6F3Y9_9SPHN|nr:sensor histidine kinase [Sphingomonas pseudosanguinis]MBB3880456.1 signal transduction histidine kinase [Sphingomonas pseudosanguinis]MBN3537293.1 CHASE3 domain-containing protein [Sphingomonas pseudosanguinis]